MGWIFLHEVSLAGLWLDLPHLGRFQLHPLARRWAVGHLFSADTGSSRFTHVVQKTWFETHTTKRERKKKKGKENRSMWVNDSVAERCLEETGVRGRQRASEGVRGCQRVSVPRTEY